MKFQILKEQGVAGIVVPAAVFDSLASTRENELKVILYALKAGQADDRQAARELRISLASVQSRLLFWEDKGLLATSGEAEKNTSDKRRVSHREISEKLESYPEVVTLLDKIQQIYGKDLNERATERFLSLFLYDNIPVDVILILAMRLAPVQKGPAYTARVIQSLCGKNGITTPEKAEEYVKLLDEREEYYRAVCSIFSFDPKDLNSSEKTMLDGWREKMGMSYRMVSRAKEAAGMNADIRYCNGILKSWYRKGYKTPDDIPPQFSTGLRGGSENGGKDHITENMHNVPVFEEN